MTSTPNPVPPAVAQPTGEQRPPVRPLLRSGTDRMAGGVCGGLAEYSGIDTVLWRVGFVVLTLLGGAGVLVYLLLWVLTPSAPLAPDRAPTPLDGLVDRLHATLTGRPRPGERG
ncbi:PspC domain-containing protein [Geodermatophilus ruber]|uniref:Phage shock protein C (PspC) family protein n=1 Tax=Geodermatophilus ruber TaxID=504800 RepID=A0A1I4G2P6_9ACTN|nr:PspC domain-containing protein [Geodermatophilus ruber]SFL24402.1 phage shock protein C (PspC) family protein [Geodermatophilus ruber]